MRKLSLLCASIAAVLLAPAVARATACEPPTVDWSKFPQAPQCVGGVIGFVHAQWGLPFPPTGGHLPKAGCAATGACMYWVYDLPDSNTWTPYPVGSTTPQAYDIAVFPPVAGDAYGHVAVVDHADGATLWVMDDNWGGLHEKSCAWSGHSGWVHATTWKPYGFFRLKALEATWGATFESQSWAGLGDAPDVLSVGETRAGWIKLKNTGGKTWPAGVVKLAPIPRDQASAWVSSTWLSPTRVSTLPVDVPPGGTGEFAWDLTATTPGSFQPYVGLVAEGATWFADAGGPTDHTLAANLLVSEADDSALLDLGSSSDLDGDGRADACALSGSGIQCELAAEHGFGAALPAIAVAGDLGARSIYTTLRLGDVDGDGRADACLRRPGGVTCWLSDGHGFDRQIVGPPLSDAAGWDTANAGSMRLADVDGDGRADLCARGVDGLTCYRSTGDGFVPLPTLAALSDAAGFADAGRSSTLRLGDIDGDGRVDVCAREAEGMACWLSGEHGFDRRIVGPAWSDAAGWGAWQRSSTIRIADVNGDGRADLCALEPEGFRCYLSDGDGFTTKVLGPALADASADGGHRDRLESIRLGDLDGDGAADLCARGAGGVTCWLSSGHGFDRELVGPALTDAAGWDSPDRYRTLRLADVNGDGRSDLCARGAAGLECWLSSGHGFGSSIAGPAWSDQAGWDVAARFESIQISGAGSAPGSGVGVTRPGGSTAGKTGSSCSAGSPAASGAAPGTLLLALAGSLLVSRRRARRNTRSES